MRTLMLSLLALTLPLSAATLQVDVARNGFAGPLDVAIATRIEGAPPIWSAPKRVASDQSSVTFPDLAAGLYLVLVQGPQPLQRLGASANVGSAGSKLRLEIPNTQTAMRVTLGGQPLARAEVELVQDEWRWTTAFETGEDGRFAGALWQPGKYTARVQQDRSSAPHITDVVVSAQPLTIDVPDRHIVGRILGDDGKPLGGATVSLRTESGHATLTVRTTSAPDGRFEFFGVREGAHAVTARAPSYLNSDAVAFELRGAKAQHAVDLKLTHGTQRSIEVIDGRGDVIANATLLAACDGHIKSTTVTNAAGQANVALPTSGSCVVYALPKEGSIGIARVEKAKNLVIRVPAGASLLRLALKSEAGDAFSGLSLLMRVDGTVVPPAIGRQLATRGLSLVTDDDGGIALGSIPPGTYEFWPYRTEAEGQLIYEVAAESTAPIRVNVAAGANNATVKFKARH